MLDRTIAPPAEKIESIKIPEFSSRNLSNGVPVYFLDSGNQEVLKIEIVLSSGVKYESIAGTSYLTSRLLTGGTASKNASQIATELDYYGAFLETSSGFDHISISIHCLKKFLQPIISLVEELLSESVFPQEELDTAIRQKVNELEISAKKDSQVAAKRFRHNLFGTSHPYGKILSADELRQISRTDVIDFYREVLFNDPTIIVSGKVDEESLSIICEAFENKSTKSASPAAGTISGVQQKQVLVRPESVQSAIRMGSLMINKHHPDIHKIQFTTSLLGGYFGSRLMKNIREEKGYTYGIGASVAHLLEASFVIISTDVVKQYTKDTLSEIEKEIIQLQEVPVSTDELETLKNYLTGKFLSGIDTAFDIAGRFRAVHLHGLDYTYYDDFLTTLREISSDDIQHMAQKYLSPEKLNTVIVGEEI